MRKSLLDALGYPSGVAPAGLLESLEAAPHVPAYQLDSSADADIALVESEHFELVEERLDDDPDALLRQARELWDADLTELELRASLDKARAALHSEGAAEEMLEGIARFSRSVAMPPDFGFEGYDRERMPVRPMDTRFETVADALGYAYAFVAAQVYSLHKKKARFRHHGANLSFVYELPLAPTKIALLADFGNGLVHSRYIASHIEAMKPHHFIYLGDVYYAGTSKEFASFVAPPLEGLLPHTNVMMLTSNHEMFSRAVPYFSYLDYRRKRSACQLQEGSYFCLRFGDAFQLIGVDTDYYGHIKFQDRVQRAWLGDVLRAGREKGAINILFTANEPFTYGRGNGTRLLEHMEPFLPAVDLWFWGNTHYCGFFDHTNTLPLSSCIGHGGYPYKLQEYDLDRSPYRAPCLAKPLFLETQPRYRDTKIRPELGNNGFVMMQLDPASKTLRLEYLDWMKKPRYVAELGRRDGRVVVLHAEESP